MRIVWTVVVVGACGGGSGQVEVHAPGVALVVAQDGNGAWQQLTLDASDTATFDATAGFYGVGVLCAAVTDNFTRAGLSFETVERHVELSCGTTVDFARVTGTTAPGAEVWIDSFSVIAGASGSYATDVISGAHDVFALLHGAPSKILVRRGVDLSADSTLDLPVATEGVAMETATPVVTGADPASVQLYSDDNTATGDYIEFASGSGPGVEIPPASLLGAGDHATVGATAHDCTRQAPLAPSPALAIPTALTATVDHSAARWTADTTVAWDEARIDLSVGTLTRILAFATSDWLAASGSGDSWPMVDLETLPGWTPGLAHIPAGSQVQFDVGLSRGAYDGDFTTCATNGTIVW